MLLELIEPDLQVLVGFDIDEFVQGSLSENLLLDAEGCELFEWEVLLLVGDDVSSLIEEVQHLFEMESRGLDMSIESQELIMVNLLVPIEIGSLKSMNNKIFGSVGNDLILLQDLDKEDINIDQARLIEILWIIFFNILQFILYVSQLIIIHLIF